ncbi:hypothetical protein Mal4_53190 [Maioricimonas rarisocia]|uniref:Carboxypeptidase regulatory-like domain-containing protein n=1 Tax=Maioricimonas rarisocia TaxID=2528026 RepID=A0A517ZES2_9PLAN|nr:hypothetical protein [Maioricimonas rarisocia]QDU40956.1 hypothetical protein Mal4_53190 [Maioricimonas rarisocia]
MRLHLTLSVLGLFFLCGCGGSDELQRVSVDGTVTLDGEPLPDGEIVLRPTDEPGAADGGKIEEGSFSFEATPGAKTVEITAWREIPGSHEQLESGESGSSREQYVPQEYNEKTTLTADIPESGLESPLTFELKTGS